MDTANISRTDKYAELVAFLCVAREGSFSAAARKLMRSPSAISKMMGRIEQRLQVRLFDRIGGRIRLTQEGERFRNGAERAVDAVTAAEDALTPQSEQLTGTLHIHTPLTVAKYLLAPLLPAFLARHPNLRVEFILGTDRGDFLQRGIDLAIHSGAPTELSLVGRALFRRCWAIAASPAYLDAHGTPSHPDELLRHRCLNFTVRTHWNAWTFVESERLKSYDIQGHVGADQGELLRTLALVGLGVARLAEFHIGPDIAAGRLIRILQPYQPESHDVMYALYPQGRAPAPRVKAFITFLEERLAGWPLPAR